MSQEKNGFGYLAVLSLAIGSIAGTTLFLGAGIGARHSGNLMLLSWLVVSAAAVYIAACFGELVAAFPRAGGSYEFAKQAYGRFFSFMVGWTAWLFGSLSVVVMVVGAVGFLFPHIPAFQQFLLSVGVIVVLNAVAYLGVGASSVMLVGFAVIMVAAPAALVAKGFSSVSFANFMPFFSHPVSTVMVTSFFMAESYFGWESATYLAEETKNPRRTIPRALMHGTITIAIVGFFLLASLIGVLGWQQLSSLPQPFIYAADILFTPSFAFAVSLGAFLALVGSAASGVVALPRLVLALARDRLFPGQFSATHSRFRTPHIAVLFQTVVLVMLLLLGFANYETLLGMMIPVGAVMYVVILSTVPLLRRKHANIERPFRVPFPTAGVVAVSALLMLSVVSWAFSVDGSLRLLELSFYLIAIGLPLYLLVELYYDPKMITEVSDLLAYLTLLTERFTFTSGMKREMFAFLGELKGKTLLEFGCGVGTLTIDLVRSVGIKGRVYAVHFSRNNLKITSKRIDDLKWGAGAPMGSATLLHDPEMFRRVYPEVGYADAVVSAGMLGYVHDIKKVLKEMWAVLPAGGRVVFTDYVDFFHVLPNVEWLSGEAAIEKTFREAGFAVRVVKKRGLLWNRIFLYGIKAKEKGVMAFI